MALGSPVTNKFSIGTAELRIGQLTEANQLLPIHSVGLIDSASLNVEQEAAELEGGFPRVLVDTAIIRQSASISATLREYSRKNILTMLGEGAGTSTTDVATTVTVGTSATVFTVDDATGIVEGDILTVYPAGLPESVRVARVAGVAGSVVTLDAGTPLDAAPSVGDIVFKSQPVAVGNVTQTNYFSVMLIQKENSTGRPSVWSFWKGAIASGLSMETSAEDFGSTDIEIKLLQPAFSEYGAGGELLHLANLIPAHPVGLFAGGGDL